MSINRFSSGPIAADVQSNFIPLPLDLIDRQLQRKQSQYDKAKAQIGAGQEAVYGVKGLSADKESLSGIVEGYDKDIDEQIEKAGGDYSRLTGYSDELSRRMTRDMKSGHLGAIHNNFIKAQNHMEETTEAYKKGNISKAGYDRAMSSISGFGGTVEDGKGGYTSASLYAPAKYLEMGKTADEYGAVIKAQYDAKGQKFTNVKKATEYIRNNMWNNPQLIENAKEQLWAAGRDPNSVSEITQYLNTVANNAAVKVAFQQIHKPEGSNELTGNPMFSYEVQHAKPKTARLFSADGTDFQTTLEKAKSEGEISVWQHIKAGAQFLGAQMGPGAGIARFGYEKSMRDYAAKNDESLKKAVKEVAQSDLAKDMAKLAGVDLNDPDIDYRDIVKVAEVMDGINNSSASTRPVYEHGKQQKAEFDGMINSGSFINMNVIDADTGEPLRKEEKDAMFLRHHAMQKDGGFAIEYAGSVIDGSGQPYGQGSTFVRGLDAKGAPRMYVLESTQTGTQEFYQDRKDYARSAGIANYRSGRDRVTMIATKEGVKVYKNGTFIGLDTD